MRTCTRCKNTSVIDDGYCSQCRECTTFPEPTKRELTDEDRAWIEKAWQEYKNTYPIIRTE